MAKQYERKVITSFDQFEFDRCSIDDLVIKLQEAKESALKFGYTNIEVEFWQEWDSAEVRLHLSRLETDEEFEKRVAKSQKTKVNMFEKFLKSVNKLNFASMPSTKQLETAKMIYDNLPSLKYLVGINVTLGDIEFNFASSVFSLDIWVQCDNSVTYRGIGYNNDRTDHERFFDHDFDASKLLPEALLNFISK